MSNYTIGNVITLSVTFKNGSGVATDPTGVTLAVKTNGATTTYTYGVDSGLIRDSQGMYHFDYTPASVGKYFYRFAGTGALVAAGESSFFVETVM